MYTRQDYLAGKVSHSDYYAQFVTERTRRYVSIFFTRELLRESLETDKHMNNIPLEQWRTISRSMPFNKKLLQELESVITSANLVCVVKEAARQSVELGGMTP